MLPALDEAEARHSAALLQHILSRIRAAGGFLDFEAFMNLALYAPGLGYYSAGSAKLGAAGDFTTAPEASGLFGRCVARQCAQILQITGGGDILELGAGTGSMAAAVLTELAALDALPGHYDILEVSADLADRQRQRLDALPRPLRERVRWLEQLPAAPLNGVILANEVLDALPCRRFLVRGTSVEELGVTCADGALAWSARPADAALTAAVRELAPPDGAPLAPGYASEVCRLAEPWIASLAACLGRGVMLLFDYGLPRAQYYHPDRATGTLTCHFRHRAHFDPLINVGVQDITAWVDFTRVARAGQAAGLAVLGFGTQAGFLLGAGIDALLGEARDERERARLAGEARRLLLPGEMGEAYKLLALGRGIDAPLMAFTHQDLSDSL
ncbi:MAG TPA: SAM-dependent methyltransferase [Steroidobacteraceae bacterium]|nr:SAM-dependent methyltransferase [Steroidobacteraceae bacterium]